MQKKQPVKGGKKKEKGWKTLKKKKVGRNVVEMVEKKKRTAGKLGKKIIKSVRGKVKGKKRPDEKKSSER